MPQSDSSQSPHPPTLAVATANPAAIAETYVRQHMRLVAPGRTVAIGLACDGPAPPGIPTFCLAPARNPVRAVANRILAFYAGAVTGKEARRLEAFLAEHGVRAILAEFGTTGCALRQFCKARGIRLVVNFHGHDATVMPRRASVRRAYRALARDADGIVCGSHYFARKLALLGFPAEKITVVPCGIEPEAWGAEEPEAWSAGGPEARAPGEPETRRQAGPRIAGRLVAVGRLTPKKAPLVTLRAFALAREKLPGLTLEMIGGGPLQAAAARLVAELGLGGAVTLTGPQSHDAVREALGRASLFVQHAMTAPNGDEESQGISLLEAMASGLAVVTTRHNGFAETVLHGETGLLCAEGDAAGMAEAIVALAGDPARAAAYGAAGRARAVTHFDAATLAARLRALLFG